MWVARDKNGDLYLYLVEPYCKDDIQWFNPRGEVYEIDTKLFPEVQWNDDQPRKVKLILEED